MSHQHTTVGIMCGHVRSGERPILVVMRDEDGRWDFVCGDAEADVAQMEDSMRRPRRKSETSTAGAEPAAVCFDCALEKDPSLAPLADLQPGASAHRSGPGERWTRTDRN